MTSTKVLMFSGGMDSVVLFYDLLLSKEHFTCCFIDYNQKNVAAELKVVERLCAKAGIPLLRINAKDIFEFTHSTLLKGSRLLAHSVETDEVPNRNATLACIAASNMHGPSELLFAAHKTPSGYADATAKFYRRLNTLLKLSTYNRITCSAPYIHYTKAQILDRAWYLGITSEHLAESISCYEGTNCGVCPACIARITALRDSKYTKNNILPIDIK